jgi:hypothetical protein
MFRDTFGLPGELEINIQRFIAPSLNGECQTWRRPRGVSMGYILCIGGGGGGGGGDGDSAGFGREGGGGGGSSGQTRVFVSLDLLPSVLYVQVGAGGPGGIGAVNGAGGGNGVGGNLSYVSLSNDITAAQNILAVSAATGPGGGQCQTNGGVAGGVAAASAAIGSMPLAGLGVFNFIGGQAGTAGGASNVAGTAETIPSTSCLCTGGAGGGGVTATDRSGGGFTAVGNTWLSEQRPATPTPGAVGGSGGPQLWKPFFSFGGCGGSSSATVVGGAGGNGAYGGGGGGGGGGINIGVAATNVGGDGGNGIVVIISW